MTISMSRTGKEYSTRERMLAVYSGETPDKVPYILDLSHYYYHKYKKPWILLNSYVEPETDLIDFNRKFNAGFYVPNQMRLFDVYYEDNVKSDAWIEKVDGNPEIHWRHETPGGTIERIRVWHEQTYSWPIKKHGVETEDDLRILADAMSARRYVPLIDNYKAWDECVGDSGIVEMIYGLSAMGYIMHYWMGMENTIFACYESNDVMHDTIDRINANNIECIKMLMQYPGYVVAMGDNFSSDMQPPSYYEEWSAPFYKEAADIIHESGKKQSVHIDGLLRKSIGMIRDTGADIIDAVTPAPMFDLTPAECREEAGDKLILSGGVPPNFWLPESPVELFERAVIEWLELKNSSSALVAAAGDQVPPGADENPSYSCGSSLMSTAGTSARKTGICNPKELINLRS